MLVFKNLCRFIQAVFSHFINESTLNMQILFKMTITEFKFLQTLIKIFFHLLKIRLIKIIQEYTFL